MYVAKLNFLQQIRIFILNLFGCVSDDVVKVKDLITRWYIVGKSKLEKELDMIHVLKSLHYLRMIRPNDEEKAQVMIDPMNVVELDDDYGKNFEKQSRIDFS